jgi:hypothetical protein
MAVQRSWRSTNRQWLIDEIVDEPGIRYRVWDAEGVPLAAVSDRDQLSALLAGLGVDLDQFHAVPVDDPWCE